MQTAQRIGVWFNEDHVSYGGPALVLLGTVLGLFQDAEASGRPIVLLLNEPGDVNWALDATRDLRHAMIKAPNMFVGPLGLTHDDAHTKDCESHPVWKYCTNVIFPSTWFAHWIAMGLPYNRPERALHRRPHLWEAGVNTDYFCPSATCEKTQDFFIYFKSQKYPELHNMNNYLFANYFKMRGTIMMYYYYDAAMLREYARKSRFCIVLDSTESQGLAALEIMACDCPLFVLDATTHVGRDNIAMRGATSVTCWDDSCGLKTEWSQLEADFPKFLAALGTYRPREFVTKNYSFQAAASRLRQLISAPNHAGTS